ncbi:uncharacterized protein LOC111351455 isoform X2 [Spodoptera litura]|uniref:Uncharacterized protein LOC111351455 isoform X2 n=1 Tax=Spodoptera litura TaxID=69820 RepID=A0A9J7DYH1_SPOLT|nr:uncharacterized protein LOC111351455 isoform X2 [Spodoptera litura]
MLGFKKCQKRTTDGKNKSKNCSAGRSGRVAYSLPKKSRKEFVDLVLTIMDSDGPKPMRNMKPVEPVLNTNNARGSVTSFEADDYVCVDCQRYERARRRRKHFRRLMNHQSYKRFKIKKANALARLMKHKRNKPYKYTSAVYQFSKIANNKGCQCATRIVSTSTKSKIPPKCDDYFLSMMPKKMSVMNAPNIVTSNRGLVLRSVESPIYVMRSAKNVKDDTDSGRPDTISSPRSTSSYNSFNSMEHEPMVK